jgi:hypothetical protein
MMGFVLWDNGFSQNLGWEMEIRPPPSGPSLSILRFVFEILSEISAHSSISSVLYIIRVANVQYFFVDFA